MNATERFIRGAIEGGWKLAPTYEFQDQYDGLLLFISESRAHIELVSTEKILFDPAAWQAVGKVRGWEDDGPLLQEWRDHFHSLIDALVEGKTIEDYLASIE